MLKGAVVGFGGVAANGHWPGYAASREASIVAVVDPAAERRALARQLAPQLTVAATLDEIADLAIDFVDICTPPALHADPMLWAVERGWHILCEKPFLLDLGVLARVRQRAADRRVAVVPVHNWKYAPIVRAATTALRAGAIGRLRSLEIETLRVGDCAAVDPRHPNWRRDAAIAGGGILMDHGWHAVYLALDWLGEEAQCVQASLSRLPGAVVEHEVRLTMAGACATASILLSWNAEVRRNRMRLCGDLGEMLIDDATLVVDGAAGREIRRFDPGLTAGSHHDDWFAAMLPDIVAAFRDLRRAERAFEEAAQTLGVIRRAYQMDRAPA